jgi:hypothetical protein
MSEIIHSLLDSVPLGKLVNVEQRFRRPTVADVSAAVREALESSGVLTTVGPGARIAVTAGSRGIVAQAKILAAAVSALKDAGAKPFIIPAMGSHGGATAEGQRAMLEGMGVTEASTGAPIESSMDVVRIGKTPSGLPVNIDQNAAEADGILLVNRVKPHVSFRGPYESGLFKMMAIGLGKQAGAQVCHDLGFGEMAKNIQEIARVVLDSGRIIGGLAILENAYHETARIEALRPDAIAGREPELLEEARQLLPKLYIEKIDVLVIDRIGKDISGTGFDTNVVGRYHTAYASGGPDVKRLVILDLTDVSHGNANGVGIADFTTERLFRKLSFADTYPNSLTSTVPTSVKIPMVLPSDRLAIQAGVRTCNVADKRQARVIRIRDTLDVSTIRVSENLLPEVRAHESMRATGQPEPLAFDAAGNLF